MRFARTNVEVGLCLILAFPTLGQQSTTPNSQTAQRDPQALTVLTQAVNAIGGARALAAVQDFTASGTITFNWAGEPVEGSLAVQGKGLNQFRMDASLPGGTRCLVINGYAGAITAPSGAKTLLPTSNALTSRSLTFPATRFMSALSDSSKREV